nr:hypothetical protein [uncultured Comamonas sp.]
MHLIDAAGHVDNQFVHEDPNTNRPPTEIDAAWLNSVQNEIASVVRGAGAGLDKDASDQLVKAVKKLAKDAMPGSASTEASGVVVLSTEEDAKAGVRDDVVVTPKGLSAAIEGLNGLPVFFNGHHDGDRASLIRVFNGMATPDDGEPLTALTHPGIVLGVLHGDVKSCTDAEWLADPYKRGMWSKGNAYLDAQGKPQGWVRMSDRNGVKDGSLPAPFWRGGVDAKVGSIGKDMMRDWHATFNALREGAETTATGAATREGSPGTGGTGSTNPPQGRIVRIDPASMLPGHTGTETVPWNITGVSYTITANGIVNEAALDAAGVMAQVLLLQGRVTALESHDFGVTTQDWVTTTATRLQGVTYVADQTFWLRLEANVAAVTAGSLLSTYTINGEDFLGATQPYGSSAQYVSHMLIKKGSTFSYRLSGSYNASTLKVREFRRGA